MEADKGTFRTIWSSCSAEYLQGFILNIALQENMLQWYTCYFAVELRVLSLSSLKWAPINSLMLKYNQQEINIPCQVIIYKLLLSNRRCTAYPNLFAFYANRCPQQLILILRESNFEKIWHWFLGYISTFFTKTFIDICFFSLMYNETCYICENQILVPYCQGN